LYRKAAEQGNARAQFNLALMYEDGNGIPKDYNEAIKWYRKAADQGSTKAEKALLRIGWWKGEDHVN
jgi:TPR repeat protein